MLVGQSSWCQQLVRGRGLAAARAHLGLAALVLVCIAHLVRHHDFWHIALSCRCLGQSLSPARAVRAAASRLLPPVAAAPPPAGARSFCSPALWQHFHGLSDMLRCVSASQQARSVWVHG